MCDTSDAVLTRYFEVHGSHLGGWADRSVWFSAYVANNYVSHLPAPGSGRLLEFGCGDGYVLNALRSHGYTQLEGIDLSPEYVQRAKQRTGLVEIYEADVLDYLRGQADTYQAILSKAVMEHVPKERLAALVSTLYDALQDGGVLVIDVPNMDWICANHERYMDITHQNGFTRESLESLLRLSFDNVRVIPAVRIFPTTLKSRLRLGIFRPLSIWLFRQFFKTLGDGEATTWFEHRAIIGIGVK